MPKHRLTTIAALLVLLGCCALAPAASASSTLLSGYGGPGQGNQAILGSTLIGGGGGSRGSGGGGSSGAEAPQSVSIEATSTASGAGAGAGTAGHGTHPGAAHSNPGGKGRRGATAGARTTPETIGRVVDVRSTSAPALGLSGTDVAYIVLAFLVLALTAALTVVLSRGGRARETRGETESG